tara:strand:+ start:1155 stop:1292 length:138 start_codon:yes stop_codon:yes gene_type:complete
VLISGIQKKHYVLKKLKKHQVILNGKFKDKKRVNAFRKRIFVSIF